MQRQGNMMRRIIFIMLAIAMAGPALAGGGKKNGDVTIRNYDDNTWDNSTNQEQAQSQDARAYADSVSSAGANANANNEGNHLTAGVDTTVNVDGDSVENNSSNVVLVPNNNTESCVRVFGLAFGKNGESGALGIPWRSAKCDYEQAADDAFAAGERDLGWFWKCQNKNLYRTFQDEGESKAKAIDDCHVRMLSTTSTNDVIEKLESRLQAADDHIELLRAHKEVCDESKKRCEDKLFGSK